MLYPELLLMLKLNTWLSLFIFALLKCDVVAYNLNVNNAKVFNDPISLDHRRGSYFGFSVALFANSKTPVILVGAPRANTTIIQDVIEPGSVYQCPIVNDTCKEWIIDKSGNGGHKRYPTVNQIKDNAWIGATIAIENKTDPKVVVCGPRWKNNIINGNRPSWFMNGACYWTVANDIKSFETEAENEFLPLINFSQQIITSNRIGVYNYGMGQAGFSLHVVSDDVRSDIALGSPGIHNWKGTPVLVKRPFDANRQTIVPVIREERRVRSGDYFGYAITSGYYFKRGDFWFASGAPRAVNMHGNVIIFAFPNNNNKRLFVKKIVEGKQHGEYFGAALASCDLNNDGKDELIVGAPQWTKDMDEGRIYSFTARLNENFEQQSFEGEVPGGKFGSALICLGDIDYDGYKDIAVGAPYEDDIGAIYIFNGNSNGLPKRYSQKIMGSHFGQGIRGFGISISEPRDINDDKYPDIAVGAYLSEKVILLTSKPVVIVTIKLLYAERKKLLRNHTFFNVDICASYDGVYAPESLRVIRLLKIDQTYGRATASIGKGHDNTYRLPDILNKSKVSCSEHKINLKENIQNIFDPLVISATVSLDDDTLLQNDTRVNRSSSSNAIINKLLSKTEDIIELPFAVDCGDDNVCTSDVQLILLTDLNSNKYVIGSTDTVNLVIKIYNFKEPAYQAKLYIYIPELLSLASVPPECMEGSRINDTLEVICDVGNPLKQNKTLILDLDMTQVRFDVDSIELKANVTSQSEDTNLLDNTYRLKIDFDIDVDIAIAGKAQEDLYSYLHQDGDKQLDSLRFQHIYEVQKFGASPIKEAILIVNVPVYWKYSTDDVQIVNINQTIGYMDGQQFHCTYSNFTPFISTTKQVPRVTNTHEKFTIEENSAINLPPDNRSLYINCTNTAVKCKQLECKLGPFTSSLSVAKLSLTLELLVLNFQANMMDGRDIIFFLSEGSVNITQPNNITQNTGHKPDDTVVATTFLGSPIVQRISTWIILLSVVLGIVLLILLILGLVKIGFFNRRKKDELEALKAETDRKHEIIIETSSSREVLDQD